jgi:hypothetical protein
MAIHVHQTCPPGHQTWSKQNYPMTYYH